MSSVTEFKKELESAIKKGDANEAIAAVTRFNHVDGVNPSWNYKDKTLFLFINDTKNPDKSQEFEIPNYTKAEALSTVAGLTDNIHKLYKGKSNNAAGIVKNMLKTTPFGSGLKMVYAGVGILALVYLWTRR